VHTRVRALFEARVGARRQAGTWEGALDAVTRWVWHAVIAPILPLVGAVEDVVLVPSGMLTMLPLHAAWAPSTDADSRRHYLLDQWTVSYAPNARALGACTKVAAAVTVDDLVVVADPKPSVWEPIGYAWAESAWARRWFPASEVLSDERATREAVVDALLRATVQHFVCHGVGRTDEPLESALILAHDEPLTLRQILALRRPSTRGGVRLAVLSACDTDQPGSELPDEVVSLPTGLIQAGVAGVVAAQWAIRSEAASLLMARFYQLWREQGMAPPTALRMAQRWLRDTTNRTKVQDLTSGLDPALADLDLRSLVRALRLRDPDDRPYLAAADWAGLSYHGV
jgi:CHAT domain-containing protein